jgi:hypothetical protein
MATSSAPCKTGGQEYCGIGGPCCPGKCFATCRETDTGTREPKYGEFALCCTGADLIICEDPTTGKSTCCQNRGDDSCEACELPTEPGKPTGAQVCMGAITGSYRRR